MRDQRGHQAIHSRLEPLEVNPGGLKKRAEPLQARLLGPPIPKIARKIVEKLPARPFR
jgi:hypothetical protein